MFLGTPHHGSGKAGFLDFLDHLSKSLRLAKKTSATKELKRWSTSLVEITTLFSEIAGNFSIASFYETKPIMGMMVSNATRLLFHPKYQC
jgi:hypothetical protein